MHVRLRLWVSPRSCDAELCSLGRCARPAERAPGRLCTARVLRAAQVEDPLSWHAANLARNRRHYSALGAAGPRAVVALADALGVGVHFNPFVRLDTQARSPRAAHNRAARAAHTHAVLFVRRQLGAHAKHAPMPRHARAQTTIKYGVIGVPRLLSDLRSWDALYVAGRMQKPVATLAADARVSAAAESNLRAALACALLLLPVRVSPAGCSRCVHACVGVPAQQAYAACLALAFSLRLRRRASASASCTPPSAASPTRATCAWHSRRTLQRRVSCMAADSAAPS